MNIKNITEEMIHEFAESKKLLARGIDYFKRGMIKEIRLDEETIIAKVRGKDTTYTLKIHVDDYGIKAECDCPYDKDNCKHTIAVLYRWMEESRIKTEHVHCPDPLESLSKAELLDVLRRLPESELKKIL